MAIEVLDFVDQVRETASLLTTKEQMLGKGLNQPFNSTNSGARKIMSSVHQSHALVLSRGEIPYVATGFENRFGERSSSIIKAEDDYEVIANIPKFSYAPAHHYYVIYRNMTTNELDVIERISYRYVTEVYGYLHNNAPLDAVAIPGSIIPKGTILRRSTGFDQFGNKTSGCNVNVAYMALDHNMEDSVIISQACSERLSAPLIRTVKIIVNENDIPLNLYGNDDMYKVFPDIGEDVKDGILFAYRREKREEAIYTQSVQRLQQLMMSDDKITIKGKVIDINLYCNNPEHIQKNSYNQQFLAYYQDRLRLDNDIIEAVGPYVSQGYKLSYALQKLCAFAKNEINGVKFIDKKSFSNITIEFTVMEERTLGVGDKVSDRYGGKGVISKIVPTELMPRLESGKPIDMIKNSSTMYNRENAGQIFELEINYISMCILNKIRNTQSMDPEEAMNMILDFIRIQSPEEYEDMKAYTSRLSNSDLILFIESILRKDCINVSNKPMTETMDIDKLGRLYAEFPWIKQSTIYVPLTDSRGGVRFVPARRKVIAAPQYCLRLKQFAEEKFSVASLSSTNLKNENTKSKASKNYREPNSNTPIKFGQMESGDLDHMGTEYVVINLLLHSLSPRGRRLVEQVATGDPYNVDVKLDDRAKNRSVEILNTRLKAMGYKLIFEKKKKKFSYAALKPAVSFGGQMGNPANMINAVEFMEPGYDYDHYYKTMAEIEEIKKHLAVMIPAVTFTEKMDSVNDLINKDE